MTKLKSLKWRELITGLKTFGFDGPFSGGKHLFMIKGDLIIRILKQAGTRKRSCQARTEFSN